MRFQRQFTLPDWNEPLIGLALEYLKSRGFADAHIAVEARPALVIAGTRGSWRGNLVSFDMTKLRAKIQLACDATGRACVDLEVNTLGQHITQWNAAVWRMEIIELSRVLQGLGRIDDIRERFERDARSAAIRWAITATIGGRRLSGAWEAELRALEEISALEQGAV